MGGGDWGGGGEGAERALAVLKEPLHVKVELHNYQIFLNFFLEQFNVSYNGGVFLLFFFFFFINAVFPWELVSERYGCEIFPKFFL